MKSPIGCDCGDYVVLEKEVKGSDTAIVKYCQACDYAFLENVNLPDNFYEIQYSHFLADRSGDDSWKNPELHLKERQGEAKDRVNIIKQFIDFDNINSLLELGSSSGFFLNQIKQSYPHIKLMGVEPEVKHRDYSNNQNINTVDDIWMIDSKYELIISFFVLEHIHNLIDFISELLKHLEAGGCLIFIVPNLNEALVKTYENKNYDRFVWQAPHLSYFTEKALQKLFSEFKGVLTTCQYQRYSISNHLNWLTDIKPERSFEYPHLQGEINNIYKEKLIENSIADTIVAKFKLDT